MQTPLVPAQTKPARGVQGVASVVLLALLTGCPPPATTGQGAPRQGSATTDTSQAAADAPTPEAAEDAPPTSLPFVDVNLVGGHAVAPAPKRALTRLGDSRFAHPEHVQTIQLTATRVATTDELAAYLWDAQTGECLWQRALPFARIEGFSRDERYLGVASPGHLFLLDAATGETLVELPLRTQLIPGSMAFDSQSDSFRVFANPPGHYRYQRTDSGLELSDPEPLPELPERWLLVHRGSWAAASLSMTELELFDVSSGDLVHTLVDSRQSPEGGLGFGSLAFSPDGRFAAACDQRGGVVTYDVTRGAQVAEFRLSAPWTDQLKLGNDGTLAKLRYDRSLPRFDVRTGKQVSSGNNGAAPPARGIMSGYGRFLLAQSPDGALLAAVTQSGSRCVSLHDWQSGVDRLPQGPTHHDPIQAVTFDPASERILTTDNRDAMLWNARTGKLERRFRLWAGANYAGLQPNGQLLVANGEGRTWVDLDADVATVTTHTPMRPFDESVAYGFRTRLGQSYELGGHVTDSAGGVIGRPFLRDSRGRVLLESTTEHFMRVLATSADEAWLGVLEASGDRSVQLHVVSIQGEHLWQRRVPVDSGGSIPITQGVGAVHPAGTELAWLELGGFAVHRTSATETKLQAQLSPEAPATCLSFAPNGQLVVGRSNGTLEVYSAESTTPTRLLRGHTGKVTSLTFSPNGKFLVSVGAELTAVVWEWPE